MPIRNLDKIFRPQAVAVIGASERPSSVGGIVLRNLIDGGFAGPIYPVNPKYASVMGLAAYGRVDELPEVPDLAVICTPARTVPDLVEQCGQVGILGVVILSAGFREIGDEGKALEERVRAAARSVAGLRIVGPNCLGVIAPWSKLNASFAHGTPSAGRVAFISQSGALCTAVLDWARDQNVGFSYFVSIGNMLDVSVGDLIDYCAQDARTEAVVLYVESIQGAREFMSAARAFTRDKPIIAFKAGRFAQSAKAAASHTGAMAGLDDVYQAAFHRAGIVRVFDIEDMFDCAELLARHRAPGGGRLAIVTNAGGPGVIATDALMERRGELAQLSDRTIAELDALLPSYWSRGNPVDILGDATPERFTAAVKTVLADPEVDAAVVILTPQAMTDPSGAAEGVIQAAGQSSKPVLGAWMGASQVQEAVDRLHQAAIPTYPTPEKAVRAFTYLVEYARHREVLYETPRELPLDLRLERNQLRAQFDTVLSGPRGVLSEGTSKAFLEAYGIPIVKPFAARTPIEAKRIAAEIGFPVVLKILSPDITHKTDVGGVELNIDSEAEVVAAFERMIEAARRARPDARIDGVTVQQMVVVPRGVELIVGAKRDGVFGSVLMVGAGGVQAELFRDRALELPPLNERLARRMLESLRSWPLLRGYRGRPAMDVDRLLEAIIRFSYLVADCPEISEADINPLLVTPDGVLALDARILLDPEARLDPTDPYRHLAIRPYPQEWERTATLKDGRTVGLRPIRPEDEARWQRLLASCSREAIWFRFRHLFKESTHEMAARFCFIDYDREIAIVAEIEEDGERQLIGVGRLVADADRHKAEYAVLVADPWQNLGLGSILTDYCLEICSAWGIRQVWAETTPQNHGMMRILQKRQFHITEPQEGEVLASKALTPAGPDGQAAAG